MQDIFERLRQQRAAARAGGGARRVEAQHAKGKLTAR
jgi:propionyl-CoA carboxylase beta chain